MRTFFTSAAWQGGKRAVPRLPECGRCGLYKECESPKMRPEGRGRRPVLLVGEAPSERDDERGAQFSGEGGKLVREALAKHGLDMRDATRTNAAICHPGGEVEDLHVDCCRPNLVRTIREVKPVVVVLLGAAAVRGFVPAEREADVGKFRRWVGWAIPSQEFGAWVCPTFSPSEVLRSRDRVVERLFREHLGRAVALQDSPPALPSLQELRSRVEVVTDPRGALLKLRDLRTARGPFAFDFESNRLKPEVEGSRIVFVSWSLDGETATAVPVTDALLPSLSDALRNPRLLKIAANLKNEERWTRAVMGHPVANWHWDTMLASHFLDNRGGITSLKFQVYVRFGVSDYDRTVRPYFEDVDRRGFNRIEECSVQELGIYNGLDSLLEWRLAAAQRREAGFDK